ncbi:MULTISPECIES: DUF3986 family protein [Bacillus]|nr:MULTISPECIES: DUF3986 family protein [Bacillus]MCB6216340.1 hypothetical protein [Bacillus paralicheniformis]MCD2368726.1 hypothetical protein [Bacillus sp. BS3(2021)]MCJ8222524.1 hypothetical protein [Bacillus paralicheniformis]MCJ8230119.1 hypothetical protein [Bacillus paralicheniformis]WMW46018.1 hypothetical protein RFN66_15190 [Bacillus paralicheniformis]
MKFSRIDSFGCKILSKSSRDLSIEHAFKYFEL